MMTSRPLQKYWIDVQSARHSEQQLALLPALLHEFEKECTDSASLPFREVFGDGVKFATLLCRCCAATVRAALHDGRGVAAATLLRTPVFPLLLSALQRLVTPSFYADPPTRAARLASVLSPLSAHRVPLLLLQLHRLVLRGASDRARAAGGVMRAADVELLAADVRSVSAALQCAAAAAEHFPALLREMRGRDALLALAETFGPALLHPAASGVALARGALALLRRLTAATKREEWEGALGAQTDETFQRALLAAHDGTRGGDPSARLQTLTCCMEALLCVRRVFGFPPHETVDLGALLSMMLATQSAMAANDADTKRLLACVEALATAPRPAKETAARTAKAPEGRAAGLFAALPAQLGRIQRLVGSVSGIGAGARAERHNPITCREAVECLTSFFICATTPGPVDVAGGILFHLTSMDGVEAELTLFVLQSCVENFLTLQPQHRGRVLALLRSSGRRVRLAPLVRTLAKLLDEKSGAITEVRMDVLDFLTLYALGGGDVDVDALREAPRLAFMMLISEKMEWDAPYVTTYVEYTARLIRALLSSPSLVALVDHVEVHQLVLQALLRARDRMRRDAATQTDMGQSKQAHHAREELEGKNDKSTPAFASRDMARGAKTASTDGLLILGDVFVALATGTTQCVEVLIGELVSCSARDQWLMQTSTLLRLLVSVLRVPYGAALIVRANGLHVCLSMLQSVERGERSNMDMHLLGACLSLMLAHLRWSEAGAMVAAVVLPLRSPRVAQLLADLSCGFYTMHPNPSRAVDMTKDTFEPDRSACELIGPFFIPKSGFCKHTFPLGVLTKWATAASEDTSDDKNDREGARSSKTLGDLVLALAQRHSGLIADGSFASAVVAATLTSARYGELIPFLSNPLALARSLFFPDVIPNTTADVRRQQIVWDPLMAAAAPHDTIGFRGSVIVLRGAAGAHGCWRTSWPPVEGYTVAFWLRWTGESVQLWRLQGGAHGAAALTLDGPKGATVLSIPSSGHTNNSSQMNSARTPTHSSSITSTTGGESVGDDAGSDDGERRIHFPLVPSGEWRHVVLTYRRAALRAAQFRFFIDGVPVATHDVAPRGASVALVTSIVAEPTTDVSCTIGLPLGVELHDDGISDYNHGKVHMDRGGEAVAEDKEGAKGEKEKARGDVIPAETQRKCRGELWFLSMHIFPRALDEAAVAALFAASPSSSLAAGVTPSHRQVSSARLSPSTLRAAMVPVTTNASLPLPFIALHVRAVVKVEAPLRALDNRQWALTNTAAGGPALQFALHGPHTEPKRPVLVDTVSSLLAHGAATQWRRWVHVLCKDQTRETEHDAEALTMRDAAAAAVMRAVGVCCWTDAELPDGDSGPRFMARRAARWPLVFLRTPALVEAFFSTFTVPLGAAGHAVVVHTAPVERVLLHWPLLTRLPAVARGAIMTRLEALLRSENPHAALNAVRLWHCDFVGGFVKDLMREWISPPLVATAARLAGQFLQRLASSKNITSAVHNANLVLLQSALGDILSLCAASIPGTCGSVSQTSILHSSLPSAVSVRHTALVRTLLLKSLCDAVLGEQRDVFLSILSDIAPRCWFQTMCGKWADAVTAAMTTHLFVVCMNGSVSFRQRMGDAAEVLTECLRHHAHQGDVLTVVLHGFAGHVWDPQQRDTSLASELLTIDVHTAIPSLLELLMELLRRNALLLLQRTPRVHHAAVRCFEYYDTYTVEENVNEDIRKNVSRENGGQGLRRWRYCCFAIMASLRLRRLITSPLPAPLNENDSTMVTTPVETGVLRQMLMEVLIWIARHYSSHPFLRETLYRSQRASNSMDVIFLLLLAALRTAHRTEGEDTANTRSCCEVEGLDEVPEREESRENAEEEEEEEEEFKEDDENEEEDGGVVKTVPSAPTVPITTTPRATTKVKTPTKEPEASSYSSSSSVFPVTTTVTESHSYGLDARLPKPDDKFYASCRFLVATHVRRYAIRYEMVTVHRGRGSSNWQIPKLVLALHRILTATPPGVGNQAEVDCCAALCHIWLEVLADMMTASCQGAPVDSVTRNAVALATYLTSRFVSGAAVPPMALAQFVRLLLDTVTAVEHTRQLLDVLFEWVNYIMTRSFHKKDAERAAYVVDLLYANREGLFTVPIPSVELLRSVMTRLLDVSHSLLRSEASLTTPSAQRLGGLWQSLLRTNSCSPALRSVLASRGGADFITRFTKLISSDADMDAFLIWFLDNREEILCRIQSSLSSKHTLSNAILPRGVYHRHWRRTATEQRRERAKRLSIFTATWESGQTAWLHFTSTATAIDPFVLAHDNDRDDMDDDDDYDDDDDDNAENDDDGGDGRGDDHDLGDGTSGSHHSRNRAKESKSGSNKLDETVKEKTARYASAQRVVLSSRELSSGSWRTRCLHPSGAVGYIMGRWQGDRADLAGEHLAMYVRHLPISCLPVRCSLLDTISSECGLRVHAAEILHRIVGPCPERRIVWVGNVYYLVGNDCLICVLVVTGSEVVIVSNSEVTPGGDLIFSQHRSHNAARKSTLKATFVHEAIRRFLPRQSGEAATNTKAAFRHSQYFRMICAESRLRDTPALVWRFSLGSIQMIHQRLFQHMPAALEFQLEHGDRYFVVALDDELSLSKNTRDKLQSVITGIASHAAVETSALKETRLGHLTRQWIRRELSNRQYLLNVNDVAGRTVADIGQYPVMPWILNDYRSPTIDLNDHNVYRDLAKPIGALNPNRAAQLRERYEQWPDTTQPPFHHGTHYSSSAIVMYYLLRLQPLTQRSARYQGGRLDIADRLFYSVAEAWESCSGPATGDTKELIPELFVLPELFQNTNHADLGVRRDGVRLGDVILPEWANGAAEWFIHIHHVALESETVSGALHQWIDLIFGHRQREEAAVQSLNVFHHLSYQHGVERAISVAASEEERRGIVATAACFGQTPRQIFASPHPKRGPPPQQQLQQQQQLLPTHSILHPYHIPPQQQLPSACFSLVPRQLWLLSKLRELSRRRMSVYLPRGGAEGCGPIIALGWVDGAIVASAPFDLTLPTRPPQMCLYDGATRELLCLYYRDGALACAVPDVALCGRGEVTAMCASIMGGFLCCGTSGGAVFVLARSAIRQPFEVAAILDVGAQSAVRLLKIWPDGHLCAASKGGEAVVSVWHVAHTGVMFCFAVDLRPLVEERGGVHGVTRDAQEGHYYIATAHALAQLSSQGTLLQTLHTREFDFAGLESPIRAVEFLNFTGYSDKNLLVTGHKSGAITFWTVETKKKVRDVSTHTIKPVYSVMVDPSNAITAIMGDDGGVTLGTANGTVISLAVPSPTDAMVEL